MNLHLPRSPFNLGMSFFLLDVFTLAACKQMLPASFKLDAGSFIMTVGEV